MEDDRRGIKAHNDLFMQLFPVFRTISFGAFLKKS